MINKYLILFFSLVLSLLSCSDGIGNSEVIDNPVEGEWNVFSDSGTLLQKKIYTPNFYTYFLVLDGETISNPDMQHYSITGGNRLVFNRYTQTFSIDNDTLWIVSSSGDITTKYIRNKEITN